MPSLKNIKFSYSSPPPCNDSPPPPPPPCEEPTPPPPNHPPCSPCQHKNHVPPPPPAVPPPSPNYPQKFAPSNPPILSSLPPYIPPWGYLAPSIAPLPPPETQSTNHIPLMVGTSLGGLFFLSFLVIGINYLYGNKLAVPKSGGPELGPRPPPGEGDVRPTAAVPHGGGTASQLKVDNSIDAAGSTPEDIMDQETSLAPPPSDDPTPQKQLPAPEDPQPSEEEKERKRQKKAKTNEVIKSLKETRTLLKGLLEMKKLEQSELMAAHSNTNKEQLDPVPDPSPETLDRLPTTSSGDVDNDLNKTRIESVEKQEIVGDGDDHAPLEDQVPEKNDDVGLQENKEETAPANNDERDRPTEKNNKLPRKKQQSGSNRSSAKEVAKTAQKEFNKGGGDESEKQDNADEDVDIEDDGVGDEDKDDVDADLVEKKNERKVTRSGEEKNEDGGDQRVGAKRRGVNRRAKAKSPSTRPTQKIVAIVEKAVMGDGDEGKSQSKNADVKNELNKTSGDDNGDAPLGDQVPKENDVVVKEAGEGGLQENKEEKEGTGSEEETDDDGDDDVGEMLEDLDVGGLVGLGMGLSYIKKWIRIRKLVKANFRVVQELQTMNDEYQKLRVRRKKSSVGMMEEEADADESYSGVEEEEEMQSAEVKNVEDYESSLQRNDEPKNMKTEQEMVSDDVKEGMQSAEMKRSSLKRNDETKRAISKNMKTGKSDLNRLALARAQPQQPKGKKPTATATLNARAMTDDNKGISQFANLLRLDEDNQDEEIDQQKFAVDESLFKNIPGQVMSSAEMKKKKKIPKNLDSTKPQLHQVREKRPTAITEAGASSINQEVDGEDKQEEEVDQPNEFANEFGGDHVAAAAAEEDQSASTI